MFFKQKFLINPKPPCPVWSTYNCRFFRGGFTDAICQLSGSFGKQSANIPVKHFENSFKGQVTRCKAPSRMKTKMQIYETRRKPKEKKGGAFP